MFSDNIVDMRDDTIDGIQNNLPKILFDRKVSIRAFARQCRFSYPTMHSIVTNEKKGVTWKQLATICHALKLNPSDVFPLVEPYPEAAKPPSTPESLPPDE